MIDKQLLVILIGTCVPAFLAAAAAVIVALINSRKLNAIHVLVNSRLSIALSETAALKKAALEVTGKENLAKVVAAALLEAERLKAVAALAAAALQKKEN